MLMLTKILKFDCMLTMIDFLSNIVDFQSSEPLTGKGFPSLILDNELREFHGPVQHFVGHVWSSEKLFHWLIRPDHYGVG